MLLYLAVLSKQKDQMSSMTGSQCFEFLTAFSRCGLKPMEF